VSGTLVLVSLLILAVGCSQPVTITPVDSQAPAVEDARAKYVFYFIADGMGPGQEHILEIYQHAVNQPLLGEPKPGVVRLTMSGFPVLGWATTYSADKQTTDSAAAGTALATGRKTSNGTVAMDSTDSYNYTSVATVAKAAGFKVGIVSSTAIADATPSVFYAHQGARADWYEILIQLSESPFDYFAGNEIKKLDSPNGTIEEILDRVAKKGFTVVKERDDLMACRPGQRVYFQGRLPYEIDRPYGRTSLADLTRKGIELLDNPNGFFMMVESAKIDYAGHGNDAGVLLGEMRALDAAVAEAVRFYQQHPTETLIVITADHDTGGVTLGCAGAKSKDGIASLAAQKQSWQAFNFEVYAPMKEWQGWESPADNIPDLLQKSLYDRLGLNYNELSADQKARLEEAYDVSMSQRGIDRAKMKPHPRFGRNDPLPLVASQLVAERAGIGFSTLGHTPMPTHVRALGSGAFRFGGLYDNTDVPKKIAQAMKITLPAN
jgi:alkaline phosphatase